MVEVGLFTAEEALAYVTRRLDPHNEHRWWLDQAGQLIGELGRLPLALAHAACYLRDRRLGCAAYRQRLTQRRLELALPADAAADYTSIVAVTWSLSIDLADRLPAPGLARPLLTLAAQLSPDGIPTARSAQPAPASACSLSSASRPPTRPAVQPVMPAARCGYMPWCNGPPANRLATPSARPRPGPRPTPCYRPGPDQDYQTQHALLAQSLRHNTDAAATTPTSGPRRPPLLFRAGRSRAEGGLPNQTVAYWTHLTHAVEDILGSDQPDALNGRSNLATAYQVAGRLDQALPLYERVVGDRERIPGAEHPTSSVHGISPADRASLAGNAPLRRPCGGHDALDRGTR